MIRNVVFDMGNVIRIYDPLRPCMRHAGNQEEAEALCQAIFLHPDWGQKVDGGLLTDLEYAKEVQKRLQSPRLQQLAEEILSDWTVDGLAANPGMDKLVDDLLAAGFRIYVLSNAGYVFREVSRKFPCVDQYSGLMFSAEEKIRKPEPEIYTRLRERFGLAPEECIFVDDMDVNVAAAQSIGMQGYVFDCPDGLRKHLKAVL